MKTKPISIRFDENDLALAQNLSGVKKPQKLVDLLIAEYVKPLKSKPIELPKDYMKELNLSVLNADGTKGKLRIISPTSPPMGLPEIAEQPKMDILSMAEKRKKISQIEFQCPKELKDWARKNWIHEELKKHGLK